MVQLKIFLLNDQLILLKMLIFNFKNLDFKVININILCILIKPLLLNFEAIKKHPKVNLKEIYPINFLRYYNIISIEFNKLNLLNIHHISLYQIL